MLRNMSIGHHRNDFILMVLLSFILVNCGDSSHYTSSKQNGTKNLSLIDRVYSAILGRVEGDQDRVDIIEGVYQSEGFAQTSEAEKLAMLRALAGDNPISVALRQQVTRSSYLDADREKQGELISSFRTPSVRFLPLSKYENASFVIHSPVPSTIWPRATNWSTQNGLRHNMDFSYDNGQTQRSGANFHDVGNFDGWITPLEIAESLAQMPFALLAAIPEIRVSDFGRVNASTGPRDGVIDYGAKNSPHPNRTLTHEAGHTLDFLVLRPNGFGQVEMDEALAQDGNLLASGYAGASYAERVAELAVVYVKAYKGQFRYELRELFQKQLGLLEDAIEIAEKAKGRTYQRFTHDLGPLAQP